MHKTSEVIKAAKLSTCHAVA